MIAEPMIPPLIFNGMRVVVSHALGDYRWLPRTWRERLFTRPWRPWASHRLSEDMGCHVQLIGGVIHASPRAYRLLSQSIEKKGSAP